MQYVLVVGFAPGHDAQAEISNVTEFLQGAHAPFRPIGFGAWIITAPNGTGANNIGSTIGNRCLQQPDHIFVTEVGPNTYEA